MNFAPFMTRLFILICFLYYSIGLKAQYPGAPTSGGASVYMVVAQVSDSITKKPITAAEAELVNSINNKVVDGLLTDSTGRLFFKTNLSGLYKVNITAVGYGSFHSSVFQLNDSAKMFRLGSVLLSRHILTIGTVEITADAPIIENKVDRLVYNASSDISSKGGSATDLLRKVPMVDVDPDGNVSIRGNSNIRVLVNGKPSGIFASSIKDALRTIPSDQIDKVEVLTNPGAKYDAEGTAGIINIILKVSKVKGTNGSVNMGGGNRSGNLGANVSIQNGKNNINVRMGGYFWRNVGSGTTNRENTVDTITNLLLQKSENHVWGSGPYASLGIDHTFNKFNSLSVTGTLRGNVNSSKSDWVTSTGISTLPLNFLYGRNSNNFGLTLGYDVNADYRKIFRKPEREWGASFLFNGNTQNSNYDAIQTNKYGPPTYKERSHNIGLNREYTLQSDYSDKITKKLLMENGVKAILRRVSSDYTFDSFNFVNNEYSTITQRNNKFYYNQRVAGAYTQFTYFVNQVLSIRAGGRYEFTTFGGGRLDSNLKFTGKPYGNFIPYFNINRKFGYTGFLRATYSQRLQRPSLFYLNPYTNYSDPRNLTTGNPYLKAEISNNVEISFGKYTSKGGISFNVYQKRLHNAIETIRHVDSAGIYRTTYGNVGKNVTTGTDMNLSLKGKTWMINLNAGLGYVDIRSTQKIGFVAGLHTTGFTYSAGLFGNYKFAKYWMVEAFARFNAPNYSLQGKSTSWYFHTIGVKRRFNKDKGGIGIGVDNPFTAHVYYTTQQKGSDFSFVDKRQVNMLGIRFNFDYRFGKIEFEQPPKPKKGIKNDDLKQGDGQGGQGGN
jgi:ferric enterobactin receptor